MTTLAVEVTAVGDSHPRKLQGIVSAEAKVGNDCVVYLGGEKFFRIVGVKGWLAPVDRDYVILFDKHNACFRVQVIASSKEFL